MTGVPTSDLVPLVAPWVASLRSRSPHTARSYEHCIRHFLSLADEITGDAIASYLDSLAPMKPASRAHHISAVRSFLSHAKKMGVLDSSPIDLLVRPHVAITSYNRFLTTSELRRLVAAAKSLSPEHHAIVLLLAGCGLRIDEARRVTWRDLFRDPDGRLGLRVLGKGGKERIVKVRADIFASLAALHGDSDMDGRDTTPLIHRHGRPIPVRTLYQMVTSAVRAAKIDKPASPHWLRHTNATLAAAGGASAFAIQASLGHASLETSARYVHIARGLTDTACDYLPAFA